MVPRPEESRCIRPNDTGFLVPDRSVEAVSQVLLDVIADGDLRQRVGAMPGPGRRPI